ncbi:MAG: family 43 glycosylhydrolase [Clostridia bacterium]|nr:family 43 glycosylhydrolase [Clostridia bacterium]
MKRARIVCLCICLLMLISCGKTGAPTPVGTTALQTTAASTAAQTTTEATTEATTAPPQEICDVLDAPIVRGVGTAGAINLYRDIVEARFGGRPKRVLLEEFDPEKEDSAVIIQYDESYSDWEYTISCDGENAEIKAKASAAIDYAVSRFLQEYVDDEGNFIPCEVRNTVLRLRDPCILPYGGKYYIVGTGYSMRVSDDLHSWSDPWQFFVPKDCKNPAFDGVGDYWAPELYEYNGKFYVFGTYKSAATGHRGVAVFRSDLPEGPYELISEGHATPKDWDSIDGSLYVDENGDPWMVFVHEWTSMPDGIGTMVASRMTPDLTALTGEITTLFSASDLVGNPNNNVTDGPYVYRFENGRLAIIWSGFADGYRVGVCYSDNGILGPWVQADEPLYSGSLDNPLCYQEGGHGMLFETFDGRLLMSFHSPNSTYEAVTYREVIAEDGYLRLK